MVPATLLAAKGPNHIPRRLYQRISPAHTCLLLTIITMAMLSLLPGRDFLQRWLCRRTATSRGRSTSIKRRNTTLGTAKSIRRHFRLPLPYRSRQSTGRHP